MDLVEKNILYFLQLSLLQTKPMFKTKPLPLSVLQT